MPRNPSELARLEDEIEYYRSKVFDYNLSKTSREAALAEVRKRERLLGRKDENYISGNL